MLLAFGAGLVSFLSPCVLPLVPVFLAYLTGTTIGELQSSNTRRLVLSHAAVFTLGFSAVFIAMGATASVIGEALFRHRALLEKTGGVVLIMLGLWMSGVLRIGFLYREARFHFAKKPAGYLGSALVGAAFAAGWTPCVGPVLSGILLLASAEGSLARGVLMLAVYSAGFALPLLLCALALERAMTLLNRVKPFLGTIEKATGATLVILGLLLSFGLYARVSSWSLSRVSAVGRAL